MFVQLFTTCDCVQVASWWGPRHRKGSTDTQGVNTDMRVALLAHVIESMQTQVRIAFHMEPYEGEWCIPGTILRFHKNAAPQCWLRGSVITAAIAAWAACRFIPNCMMHLQWLVPAYCPATPFACRLPGRTLLSVREDLEYLAKQYATSTALLKIDGKPVFYM